MRVWIDATQHDEQIEVFGMTLLERLLRGLLDAQRQISGLEATEEQLPDRTEASGSIADFATKHLELTEVRIELAPATAFPRSVPQPLLDELPITWSTGNATLRERLREATLILRTAIRLPFESRANTRRFPTDRFEPGDILHPVKIDG